MAKTIAVIGGGASGLTAAVCGSQANDDVKIVILERMDRVGKKILATGNGRCNFTNINASVYDYYGENPQFAEYALSEFPPKKTIEFFKSLGIFPKEEKNGKMYPYSDQASSIVDALRNEIECRKNIEIKTDFEVAEIKRESKRFKIISSENKTVYANGVIIAGGGCASPNLGSNGSCFRVLKKLGHRITDLAPVLVQMKTPTDIVKGLSGIKFNGKAVCYVNDEFVAEEEGEILFTDYGLSGPPIFQLSTIAGRSKNVKISLDFMPEYGQRDIFDILCDRRDKLSKLKCDSFFTGLFNKRIGNAIAKKAGIEKLSFPVKNVNDNILRKMARLIKDFEFEVIGMNGWNNAQVTAGGAATEEFDEKSMESKITEGIYCCGEVLDIFGDCGGYNLQWAWASGYLAGRSAVLKIAGEKNAED